MMIKNIEFTATVLNRENQSIMAQKYADVVQTEYYIVINNRSSNDTPVKQIW